MKNVMIVLALAALWIYILSVFGRKKLEFFRFLTGSVGMFLFLFFILEPVLTAPLARMVCWLTGWVGKLLGSFKAYSSYGILFIENANGPVSLYVDFECAGLVEILVFLSLITFFAVYTTAQKFLVGFLGTLWIILSNIIRLTVICCIIHVWGNESYYLAHTIVGRVVFYGLSVMMYFYVFTRSQVRKQKVGEFQYDEKND